MLNSQNISRRNLFRLSRSAACALGLSLVALPNAANAEELPGNVNDAGEYTFVPAESLTPDELPPETEVRARSLSRGAKVVNLGGKDRYETVATEALYAFPSSSTAVVTSGVGYADSIAVSGLAGALGCPILLTNLTHVPDATLGALSSMGVKKIVLIGSEKVASSAVMSKLRTYGSVERIWGPDRYATQMAVYEYGAKKGLWDRSATAIVASATDFADALSASPVAYALKAPVFFCDSSKNLPSKQASALESGPTSVKNFLLLGSPEVTSRSTERFLERLASARGGSSVRLGGANRYETSMAVAEHAVRNLGFSWNGVAFASGRGPYDSLGGGVVQGREKSVLLLADETSHSSVNVISQNGGSVATNLKFFGSTVVVPGDVRAKICAALHVPYFSNTSFVRYGITRDRMARLQVARNEGNGYGYEDFYKALDPDQHEYGTSSFHQFALLTEGYSGTTAAAINSYVANNCSYSESSYGRRSSLRNLGSAFVRAAQESGVNEVYLLAHAILESGWGCSELACGWVPDKDGEVIVNGVHYPYKKGVAYYNFYGIGAVDSNALAGGRALAVKEGWTTPELAVRGAAEWISGNYLRRSSGAQDTVYLMKWDVVGAEKTGSAWHEYCTGLDSWCNSIARLMDGCYKSAGRPFGDKLSFCVPVYAN